MSRQQAAELYMSMAICQWPEPGHGHTVHLAPGLWAFPSKIRLAKAVFNGGGPQAADGSRRGV